MNRRPQGSTLFPYTTLFRSAVGQRKAVAGRFEIGIDAQGRMEMLPRFTRLPRLQQCLGQRETELLLVGQSLHYFCVMRDRKSTRLNSSHSQISYAVFCLKKK